MTEIIDGYKWTEDEYKKGIYYCVFEFEDIGIYSNVFQTEESFSGWEFEIYQKELGKESVLWYSGKAQTKEEAMKLAIQFYLDYKEIGKKNDFVEKNRLQMVEI